jgi:hypothetical protein
MESMNLEWQYPPKKNRNWHSPKASDDLRSQPQPNTMGGIYPGELIALAFTYS